MGSNNPSRITPLEDDYTLSEVAAAIKMSERWLRNQIAAGAIECNRYGHKIRFTAAQVAQLRTDHAAPVAPTSITTGRRKTA